MTELSFLIELLLNHELPKPTKDLIAARIKEVEVGLCTRPIISQTIPHPSELGQSPSTAALMAKHKEIVPPSIGPIEIAQTAATAAAMQARQQTIAQAISGKHEKGQAQPRKW